MYERYVWCVRSLSRSCLTQSLRDVRGRMEDVELCLEDGERA